VVGLLRLADALDVTLCELLDVAAYPAPAQPQSDPTSARLRQSPTAEFSGQAVGLSDRLVPAQPDRAGPRSRPPSARPSRGSCAGSY
jgi:hypothetical protein